MRLIASILLIASLWLGPADLGAEPSPVQEAWAIADDARRLARDGHNDLAIDLYRQALETAPDVASIRRDYAVVLGWAGRYAEASREFLRVAALQPNQPEWARLEMANAHLFSDRNEEALELYDSLFDAGYREEALLTRRGLSLLRVGRLEEAETAYREALALFPDSEPAAVGVVRSVAEQGRVGDAYTIAVSWGADKPADSEIRVLIAKLLTKIGRYRDSLDAFDALPAERFEDPEIELARVVAARLAGDSRLFLSDLNGSFYAADHGRDTVHVDFSEAPGELSAPPAVVAGFLRDHGVNLGRKGEPLAGSVYAGWALLFDPGNVDVRRDYAVLLNWAEEYGQAREEFEKVLAAEPNQPAWVRSEIAQAELFGGAPDSALEELDGLIAEGRRDARNLTRRGLALRWMGRSEAAEEAYREVMEAFPERPDGAEGLIQALADRHRFSDALSTASRAVRDFPDEWRLRKTQAQVMNWAGLHLQARKALKEIPVEMQSTGEVMHHRALAARWSARPREAFRIAWAYSQTHPEDRQAQSLLRDLSKEYGSAIRVEAEGVGDSTGYSYRGTLATAEVALSEAHRVRLTHGYRRYFDRTFPMGDQATSWNRYELGWNGSLGKRLTADLSVAQLDYDLAGERGRVLYGASARFLATDRIRLGAGAGSEAVETTRALRNRLTADTVWTEAEFRPLIKLETAVRYSRTDFNDGLNISRQAVAANAFWIFSRKAGQRIRLGGRSLMLRHDGAHPDFWSPRRFVTHLGVVHARGRLPGRVDYVAELGVGAQWEDDLQRQTPFVGTLELAKRLNPSVWMRVKGGYSNAGLERINNGAPAYRFWYFRGGLDFRLGRLL